MLRRILYRLLWLKTEFQWRILGKRYKVEMSDEAKEDYEKLTDEDKKILDEAISQLSKNPYIGERMTQEEMEEEMKNEN